MAQNPAPEGTAPRVVQPAPSRAIALNMGAALMGKGLGVLVGLVTTMLLTRHLGPEDYGLYRSVLTWVLFASLIGDLGLYMVLLREISRREDPGEVIGAALMLRLVATGSVLTLAAVACAFLPVAPSAKAGMFVGAAYFTAYQSSELLVAVFQKALRQTYQAMAEALGSLALLALTIFATLAGGGVEAMLAALFGGATVTLALMLYWGRRLEPIRLHYDPALWRQLVVAGLPMAGSRALSITRLRTDMLLLAVLQPAAAVGLYGVPTKVYEIAANVPFLFGGLMMPLFVEAFASGDRAQLLKRIESALIVMIVFGGGVALATVVFAREIVVLLAGDAYAAAWPSLAMLGPSVGLTAVAQVCRFALMAAEHQRRMLIVDASGTAFALIVYVGLIAAFSQTGAAAGRLLVETVLLAGLAVALSASGLRPHLGAQLLKWAVAMACGAAVMLLADRIGGLWALSLVLGGLAYLAMIVALGVVSPRALRAALRT